MKGVFCFLLLQLACSMVATPPPGTSRAIVRSKGNHIIPLEPLRSPSPLRRDTPLDESGAIVGVGEGYYLLERVASIRSRRSILPPLSRPSILPPPDFVTVAANLASANDLALEARVEELLPLLLTSEASSEASDIYSIGLSLGKAYHDLGEYGKAVYCLRRSLAAAEAGQGGEGATTSVLYALSQVYHDSAACHTGRDEGRGRALQRQGVEYLTRAHGERANDDGDDSYESQRRGKEGGTLTTSGKLYSALCQAGEVEAEGEEDAMVRSFGPGGEEREEEEEEEEEGGLGGFSQSGYGIGDGDLHHASKGGEVHHGYTMRESVGVGGYGEVWRALRRGPGEEGGSGGTEFILKRLFVERGDAVRLSGLREAYFGAHLRGIPHVCRFVESFEESHGDTTDLWLVFCSEGLSLSHYLYDASTSDGYVLYSPSAFWSQYRRSGESGEKMIRELIRQLIEGVANCHLKQVTHRDLKPSNLIVHIPSQSEVERDGMGDPVLKLADFGSAVDVYSNEYLYGDVGPSQGEETLDYAPPEVLFGNSEVPCSLSRPTTYDMWSCGIIFLELVLGTSKVFQISGRQRARIANKMKDSPPEDVDKACLLQAMIDLGIYPPPPRLATNEMKETESSDHVGSDSKNIDVEHDVQSRLGGIDAGVGGGKGPEGAKGLDIKCDEEVGKRIKDADELGLGMPNKWAIKLLRRLLMWRPDERGTAQKALRHAYFNEGGLGFRCRATGESVHEYEDDCLGDGCTGE